MIEDAAGNILRKQRFFYGYVIVIAGFFYMLVAFGAIDSFGVFFKPLSAAFGWTRAETSGAFALYQVVHGLSCIVVGRLGDRFHPRVVVTVCGIMLGSGFLLMSRVSTLWQFYLYYALMGIGMSGFVTMVSTLARWFLRRRGLATGIALSGIGFGIIITPPLATQLILTRGWDWGYMIVGAVVMVVIVVVAQFLRRSPDEMGQVSYGSVEAVQDTVRESQGMTFHQALRTRTFWMIGAAWFCFFFAQQVVLVHIVPRATDIGISPVVAAGIISVIGGLSILGRLTMGGATDRIGIRTSLVIVYSVLAVALFWLLAARELWMFYVFAALFGFAYGGVASLNPLSIGEFFGLRAHGTILGMAVFIATVGGAIGPIVAGRIYDITQAYQPAFIITSVLGVIGLVGVVLIKLRSKNTGAL